jgi:hypothetical protein
MMPAKSSTGRLRRSSFATTRAAAPPSRRTSSAIRTPGRLRSLAEYPASSISSTSFQPRRGQGRSSGRPSNGPRASAASRFQEEARTDDLEHRCEPGEALPCCHGITYRKATSTLSMGRIAISCPEQGGDSIESRRYGRGGPASEGRSSLAEPHPQGFSLRESIRDHRLSIDARHLRRRLKRAIWGDDPIERPRRNT